MSSVDKAQDAGWRATVAKVSLGLSIFAVLWFVIAAVGARFGAWSWQFGLGTMTLNWGLKLIFLALGVSVVAMVLALIKAPRKRAFILSLAALLVAGLSFGRVAAFGGQATRLPPIHDVQTDWSDPIQPSERLVAERKADGAMNPIEDAPVVPEAAEGRWPGTPGRLVSELQEEAEFRPEEQDSPKVAPYPKLDTYEAPVAQPDAFATIVELVKDRGWKIVSADAAEGRIEATETSFWFGFKDDVMIRVLAMEAGGTRIDVRSTSRVGLSDLGANAKRVRNLLDDIEVALH
ncbi:DUF1499 domain-containing protein [Hyphomonas pacifica]|uniref:DUF1499 domain-containing protein n=1 Tax=Hyphomonas pacifica TaxID=1280941 RepID=UPI000DC00699|nr:DUF1499 domain-containing protein [Hyphomonas pacifica]RAN32913.1 hypothetical protein HY11_04285 [Hyphomonas pacifica]